MSKISELSNGGALLSTDDLIVVRSGGNVRAQLSSITGQSISATTLAASGASTLTGAVGINITPTSYKLTVNSGATTATTVAAIGYNGDAGTNLYITTDHGNNLVSLYASGNASKEMRFLSGTLEVMRLGTTGNVGIGVTAPTRSLVLGKGDSTGVQTQYTNSTTGFGLGDGFTVGIDGSENAEFWNFENTNMLFATNGTERIRIDGASGNLGVGTVPSAWRTAYADKALDLGTHSALYDQFGGSTFLVNNFYRSSNGDFKYKTTAGATAITLDAGSVGFLTGPSGTAGATATLTNRMTIDVAGRVNIGGVGNISPYGIRFAINGTGSGGAGLYFGSGVLLPTNNSPALSDNTVDLGAISYRFNDAFVTNGVTAGSDGNLKQDIAELTDAEQRVAVAAKGLLRKFRWIDAVEAKGDDARIHFGIIAQDLQAAFEAEALDAGRYAMFMSNTWWETETEVAAVEATEDTDAVDAYTRTDTYDTAEEAPEGATERTRLGVRYSELLAFIISAI